MNKFYLLILCFFTINAFSQQVVVEYYENRIVKNKSEIQQLPQSLQKDFEPNRFAFTLIYADGYSLYENQDFSHLLEEEEEVEEIFDLDDGRQVQFIGKSTPNPDRFKIIEKIFYKDYLNKKIYAELFTNEKKQIVDDFFDWNWEITDEEKEINGYLCKKAITRIQGYHFEAWFTEDIPISTGPEKFDGLPGLILYVNTGGIELVAKSIKFPEGPIDIEKPSFLGETYTFDEVYTRKVNHKPTITVNRVLEFQNGPNKGEKKSVQRVSQSTWNN